MTTMTEPTQRDVDAAGRPFPTWDQQSDLRNHLQDCRAWWLDVAERHLVDARRWDHPASRAKALALAERARDASRDYKAVA